VETPGGKQEGAPDPAAASFNLKNSLALPHFPDKMQQDATETVGSPNRDALGGL